MKRCFKNAARRILAGLLAGLLSSGTIGAVLPAYASDAHGEISYKEEYGAYGVTDTIDLGNREDESAHKFSANYSQIVNGAAGERARVALPKSTPEYWGGDLTFTIKVDPDAQNYFTLKLWGGDESAYRCYLAVDNELVWQSPLVIAKTIEEAPVKGRFYYSTTPIPLEKTKGRENITVTLKTGACTYAYGAGSVEKWYNEKMESPSGGYYFGYVHTSAALSDSIIRQTGTLTNFLPDIKAGTDADPESEAMVALQSAYLNKARGVLNNIVTNGSDENYTTTTWNHKDSAHGSGTMIMPYSQNTVNLNNMRTAIEIISNSDSEDYDAVIRGIGFDVILDSLRNGMDRLVINYLNRPATVQIGGHQSSWGGFYQGMGETLWMIRRLFEGGRAASLGTSYESFSEWFQGDEKIAWYDTFSSIASFSQNENAFQLENTTVESDPINTSSRKSAYEEILWLNFNYARTHAYTLTPLTNQVMFQMYGAFLSNAGLLAMDSEYAENYESSLRFLYRSSGILPYFDIDVIDGTVEAETDSYGNATGKLIIENIEKFDSVYDENRNYIGDYRKVFGENYYLVTEAGLTRETTYAAGYGEHADLMMHAYQWTGDMNFVKKLLESSNARAHLRYQDVDSGENRAMLLEATIECRGPFYPYNVGYGSYLTTGNGNQENKPFQMAYFKKIIEEDLEAYRAFFGSDFEKYYEYAEDAVAYAQQMLEDNQYSSYMTAEIGQLITYEGYKYVTGHSRVPKLMPGTNLSWYTEEEIQKIREAGFDEEQLYGESFYDIDDSVVMFRNDKTNYYLAFQYKSDAGLNGVSRIHAVSQDYDTIAMIEHEVQYKPSGYWNTTPEWTNYDLAFDPITVLPDQIINARTGEITPVAAYEGYENTIQVQPSKSGSPLGGYGEFYSVQYGRYLIAMNTTRESSRNERDYTVILPDSYTGDTIYDKITNTFVPVVDHTVKVPAYSCIVLDLGTDSLINDVPVASIFASAVSTNGRAAVTWSHAANVDRAYEIERSQSPESGYEVIGTVSSMENIYIDNTVENGVTYYYRITGINSSGKKGNPSVYAKVTPSDSVIPNTAWAVMDLQGETRELTSEIVEEGKIVFSGLTQENGALLFAYTNNVSEDAPASRLQLSPPRISMKEGDTAEVTASINTQESMAPVNGDFEFITKVEDGEEIGIMFRESLTEYARGGFFTIDSEGNYNFTYRQYPSKIHIFNMVPDGYNVYNDMNPLPVAGRVEGASWLKVKRTGQYMYLFVSRDNQDWIPIGGEGYVLYPQEDEQGNPYFTGNYGWSTMEKDEIGTFWIPMAEAIYIGIASNGSGIVTNTSFAHINETENYSVPSKVTASIYSDPVGHKISLAWTNISNAEYFQIYKTADRETAETNPLTDGRWVLLDGEVRDYKYSEENLTEGTDGAVYYKIIAFNSQDRPGEPSDVLVGEIDLSTVQSPASVWNTVNIGTAAGYELVTGEAVEIFTDGDRVWNTDGNSFRFVYQEIEPQSSGTYITRVDKALLGANTGAALMIRNGLEPGSYHRAIMVNASYGVFGEWQGSGRSSRIKANTVQNQDVWLKIVTLEDSEEMLAYYAPATDAQEQYPQEDEWVLFANYEYSLDTATWQNLGSTGKWYVGLALATGGTLKSEKFYNTAPLFDAAQVTFGEETKMTNHVVVHPGATISVNLNVRDAFGIRDLPKESIELVGELPVGAEFHDGVLRYMPPETGSYSFSFRARDTESGNDFYGGTDITVEVMDQTRLPVIRGISDRTIKAQEKTTFEVSAVMEDISTFVMSQMEYEIVSVHNNLGESLSIDDLGIIFEPQSGYFEWTPAKNQTQTYTMDFQATDCVTNVSSNKQVVIKVIGAPVFQISDSIKQEVMDGSIIAVKAEEVFMARVQYSDPNGAASYSYFELPEGMSYDKATGLLTWRPTYLQGVEGYEFDGKIVAYNSSFKEEVVLHFQVEEADELPPSFIENWNQSAFSADGLAKMTVSYSSADQTAFTIKNTGHNGVQTLGRAAFNYQKLTGDAVIIARVLNPHVPGDGGISNTNIAGVMISDLIGPDPITANTVNKSAVMVYMGIGAHNNKFDSAIPSEGNELTNAIAFGYKVRGQEHPGKGGGKVDRAELSSDNSVAYYRLDFTVNEEDGTGIARGSYSLDGVQWSSSENWNYTFTQAQVAEGLYASVFASSKNSYVTKFDNARVIQTGVEYAQTGEEYILSSKAFHVFDNVRYEYSLMDENSQPIATAEYNDGEFSWIPEAEGEYSLELKACAGLSGMEAQRSFKIIVRDAGDTDILVNRSLLGRDGIELQRWKENTLVVPEEEIVVRTAVHELSGSQEGEGVQWKIQDPSLVGIEISEDGSRALLTGLKEGVTALTVSYNGQYTTGMIHVSKKGVINYRAVPKKTRNLKKTVNEWSQDSRGWRLLLNDGTYCRSQWILTGGHWYWFDEDTYMASGWRKVNHKWYFMNSSGAMVSDDWVFYNGKWYFLNTDGSMRTGWVCWKDIWYYLNQDGDMAVSGITPDGYRINENGAWVQ